MSKTVSVLARILSFVAILTCVTVALADEKGKKEKVGGHLPMHLHHMHTMMNHGLTMVLQGSNLVMLSEMKMAPGVDEITLAHGKKMMADGKAMIQEMLSGEHMTRMHKEGYGSDPLMKYTHELGNAELAVATGLEDMKMTDMNTPDGMKMHHMHIALNHALEMAADGANLVMMGEMKMAKGVDKHTIDHGRKMIADAQQLWKDVMSGQAMSAMHAAGTTPESSGMMGTTHKLANDEKKVLELLANMPPIK